MVSDERMKQLEAYVKYWEDALERSNAQLNWLFELKEHGATITNDTDAAILEDRIFQEDYASKQFHKGLIRAKSKLDLAKAGEDV